MDKIVGTSLKKQNVKALRVQFKTFITDLYSLWYIANLHK